MRLRLPPALPGDPSDPASAGVLGYVAGAAATAAIFLWLAWSGGRPGEAPPVLVNDTAVVILPDAPPRPPVEEIPDQPLPALNQLLMLREERTDSEVKLPAVPLVPEFVPESAGRIQFELSLDPVKPSPGLSEAETRRVFQPAEVDEQPRAVYKKIPRITSSMLKGLRTRQIRFLFIVNLDGKIHQLRVLAPTGDPTVDAHCVAAIKSWKFTPAVRKGRPVRCWVEQTFTLVPSTKSPFDL